MKPSRPAKKTLKAVPTVPAPATKPSKPTNPTEPKKQKAAPTAPAAAPAPAPAAKPGKLVRDSFTLPAEDFALIAVLKDRALDFKRPTKKSELLRAGLQALAGLDQAALQASLDALRALKAGRPKK